jgi:FixJ family two-component response regulator
MAASVSQAVVDGQSLPESTVFVVDDDVDLRESLCCLIQSAGLPVQAYDSAQAFLDAYEPVRPGCLVLDVRLQGMSGLALQDHLGVRGLAIPIIIITAYGDVSTAVRSLKAGALEFIEKPFSDQVLLDRIHHAIRVDRQHRQRERLHAVLDRRMARLTSRELEVLDSLVAGKSLRAIATELALSVRTVEIYRTVIHRKMEVDSTIKLVRLILAQRLLAGQLDPADLIESCDTGDPSH